MIKFFRKIRQQLLSENKFSKYLLYAIGEIVLVVVGILIALQVNNWNQSQQRSEKERRILSELLMNLNKDRVDNEENVEWYERVSNSAKIVNNSLEQRIPWHDSLSAHFGNLYTHGISTLNVSAYENLKSTGFDLISNDSIRMTLIDLHSIHYELIQKIEREFSMDNFNQVVLPVLISKLKMDKWFHAVPLDYEALMDDVLFQETVRFRGITMAYVGGNTNSANKKVRELIRMVEMELARDGGN